MSSADEKSIRNDKRDHGVAISTRELDTGAQLLAGADSIELDDAERLRIRYVAGMNPPAENIRV